MMDPTKLLASASRLYGEEMERLFGEFLPVPASNLEALEGGEVISLGSHQLDVLYTPGHASHHVTYFDPADRTAFVGDTAGISILGHPFMLPATPPPDIARALGCFAQRNRESGIPQRLFLTHFSFSDDPPLHLANYRERLFRWRDLSAAILARNLEEPASMHRFAQEIAAEAAQFLTPEEISQYVFNGALHLSWLGLARYHRKRTEAVERSHSR